MYCNIVFMIDIFVISKITQYRYYVIAITDVRSLGLSTKWRTLMIKKTMKVRENTFRKLEDPFENGAAKKYVFYVKVDDVAEGIPMATNPRDQKLTSGVATAIKESLLSNDGYFHLKNRGIVLSAESVHYNNKEKIATIIFSDELSHGNIDGGHTYKIVCEHKGENLEQYVQFEVMTGVEDIIENLAEARNTSVQVDAKSMAELAEKFDPIKEGLEGMPFFKRIAFKQNQISVDDETGKKNKMIVLVFPPMDEDDKFAILPYFWIPEDTLELRVRRDHVPYDIWERQGFLQTTEGNVVHYGYIEKFIEQLGERFNIREIAFDRWGAVQMVQNLEGMEFTVVPFGQGFKDMSPPTKELMKLTLEQKLAHGGHPVLRWMMDNIFIRTDPAGNIKADKEKSTEKIDGAIATIIGLDRAIRCGNMNTESVYDARGILFI